MIRAALIALLLLTPAGAMARAGDLPPQVAGSYDTQNPFARIIRGELPAAKVYEDRYVLAFMDNHPAQPGHVLVISKTSKARNLLDVSPRDLARLMVVVQRVARAQLTGLNADGVTIMQNNGSSQSVFHLHIHVIPRTKGVYLPTGPNQPADIETLRPIAAKIAAAMR